MCLNLEVKNPFFPKDCFCPGCWEEEEGEGWSGEGHGPVDSGRFEQVGEEEEEKDEDEGDSAP